MIKGLLVGGLVRRVIRLFCQNAVSSINTHRRGYLTSRLIVWEVLGKCFTILPPRVEE